MEGVRQWQTWHVDSASNCRASTAADAVQESIRGICVIRGSEVFFIFRVTNWQILRSTSVNGPK
jgi:hypothetical protein